MHVPTPQSAPLLAHGIRRGLRDAWRDNNGWLIPGTLCAVMLLLQLLIVTLAGTHSVHGVLQRNADVRITMRSDASSQDAKTFFAILQQEPYIRNASYITKEQAYERARTHDSELISFLESSGQPNPFHDTVGVTLRSLGDFAAFQTFAEQPQWRNLIDIAALSDIASQRQYAVSLSSAVYAGRTVTFVLLGAAIIALSAIVVVVARMRDGRRATERRVRLLAGAVPLSLLTPATTSIAAILFAAAAISAVAGAVLISIFPSLLPALFEGARDAVGTNIVPIVRMLVLRGLAVEVIMLCAIAGCGTWLALHSVIRPRAV